MIYREHQLQRACFQWFCLQYPQYRCLFIHCPNERQMTVRQAARLKSIGLQPGCPDVLIPVRSGNYIGLAIEMKAGKNTVKDTQREMLTLLEKQDWQCHVVRTFDDFQKIVNDYLK